MDNDDGLGNQMDSMHETDQRLLYCLNRYWGYKSFKYGQLEVCRNILINKRDCFVSMATGSGKSLMFQLPAVTLREFGIPGISLVISPLLSLIEDQIRALLSMNIPACSLATPEMERMVMDGIPVVVYTTPEKLQIWKHNLGVLHHKTPIMSVAIDESHCVSEWGHDFRHEYRLLNVIREILGPNVPIIALTASATPTVEEDIIQQLQLVNVLKIKSGLNRSNLKYIVKNKSSPEELVEIIASFRRKQLREIAHSKHTTVAHLDIDSIPFATTLIYVNSKKLCEEVANYLVMSSLLSGIQVAFYHADMTIEERHCVHHAFLNNEVQVIVSTTAFGMGINKADVRLIVHYGLALSVEGYYQQTGRAGRDQQPSLCYMLWSLNDVNTNYHLVKERPGGVRSIDYMKDYARGRWHCRRQAILQYFGETLENSEPTNHCCDLCDERINDQRLRDEERRYKEQQLHQQNEKESIEQPSLKASMYNSICDNYLTAETLSYDIYMLIYTIADCGGYYGLTVPVNILMGRNDKTTQRIVGYADKKYFAQGKHRSAEWWKALARDLAVEHTCRIEVPQPESELSTGGKLMVEIRIRVFDVCTRKRVDGYSYQCYQVSEQSRRYLAGHGWMHSTLPSALVLIPTVFRIDLHCFPVEQLSFSSEFLHHHKLCLRHSQQQITGTRCNAEAIPQSRFASSSLLPAPSEGDNAVGMMSMNELTKRHHKQNQEDQDHEKGKSLNNSAAKRQRITYNATTLLPDTEWRDNCVSFEDMPPLSPVKFIIEKESDAKHVTLPTNTASIHSTFPSNSPSDKVLSPAHLLSIRESLVNEYAKSIEQSSNIIASHRVISRDEIDLVSQYLLALQGVPYQDADYAEALKYMLRDNVLSWDELRFTQAPQLEKEEDAVAWNRWQCLCDLKQQLLDAIVHAVISSNTTDAAVVDIDKVIDQDILSVDADIHPRNSSFARGGSYGRSAEYLLRESAKQRASVFKVVRESSCDTSSPSASTTRVALYRPNYALAKESDGHGSTEVMVSIPFVKQESESILEKSENRATSIHPMIPDKDTDDDGTDEGDADRDIFAIDYDLNGEAADPNADETMILDYNQPLLVPCGTVIQDNTAVSEYFALAQKLSQSHRRDFSTANDSSGVVDSLMFEPSRFLPLSSSSDGLRGATSSPIEHEVIQNDGPRSTENFRFENSAGIKAMRKKSAGIAGSLGKRLRTVP